MNSVQDISWAQYSSHSVRFKTINWNVLWDHAKPLAAYTNLFKRFSHAFGLTNYWPIEISCPLFLEANLIFRKLLPEAERMDHLIFIWLLPQLIILRRGFAIFLKELRIGILLKWACTILLLFSYFLELIFLNQYLKERLLLFFMTLQIFLST